MAGTQKARQLLGTVSKIHALKSQKYRRAIEELECHTDRFGTLYDS